ncbi:MAG: hypothetical protein H0U10_03580, partial [Chloroflexia bacterium]|nr:hypothetical protein [Chloroflexia bacterium]
MAVVEQPPVHLRAGAVLGQRGFGGQAGQSLRDVVSGGVRSGECHGEAGPVFSGGQAGVDVAGELRPALH